MSLYRKGKKGKLDKIFSLYIRTRDKWGCQRCGKQQKEKSTGYHCAHILGRSKQSVRWNELNAYGICYGCHLFIDTHPTEKTIWAINRLWKQEYDELCSISIQNVKFRDWEVEDLIKYYKDKLEKLNART